MIDELRARNVALIRDASIEPAPGLTVLTGETGAGKTALLSSIQLQIYSYTCCRSCSLSTSCRASL